METKITSNNDPRKYVAYNLAGYPYNCKYPPNTQRFGTAHEGYANKAEGVLFYDFAVLGYDVEFAYNGRKYYLLNDGEAHLSDPMFSQKIKSFEDPMNLIEKLEIDGKPLIQILDQIEEIEPV